MRKVLLVALASLVWLGSWAPGSRAEAEELLTRRSPPPGVHLMIQGKVRPTTMTDFPVDFAWVIEANGERIFVDFDKDPKLQKLADGLQDKLVLLMGKLENTPSLLQFADLPAKSSRPVSTVKVIRVTSLEEITNPNSKEDIRATAVGSLKLAEWQPKDGRELWELTAGKQKFIVEVETDKARAAAKELAGRNILATGTIRKGTVALRTVSESM